jgi:hypothetical protein
LDLHSLFQERSWGAPSYLALELGRRLRRRHRWRNARQVENAAALAKRAYDAFVKQINCVCGAVVKGKDDDELWETAQAHLHTDHPDLVGKVSREDILAQAEET